MRGGRAFSVGFEFGEVVDGELFMGSLSKNMTALMLVVAVLDEPRGARQVPWPVEKLRETSIRAFDIATLRSKSGAARAAAVAQIQAARERKLRESADLKAEMEHREKKSERRPRSGDREGASVPLPRRGRFDDKRLGVVEDSPCGTEGQCGAAAEKGREVGQVGDAPYEKAGGDERGDLGKSVKFKKENERLRGLIVVFYDDLLCAESGNITEVLQRHFRCRKKSPLGHFRCAEQNVSIGRGFCLTANSQSKHRSLNAASGYSSAVSS